MKIQHAVILFSSIIFSSSVLAASQSRERWFDIEVILISQLSDKNALKEVFADDITLPKFKHSVDLLTPYLLPDIAYLKQKLPFCNNTNQLIQYHADIKQPSIVTVKSLAEIAEIAEEVNQAELISTSEASSLTNDTSKQVLLSEQGVLQDQSISNIATDTAAISEQSFENNTNEQTLSMDEIETPITAEQRALVTAAEDYFSPIKFTYSDSSAVANSEHLLCQITEKEFNALSPDPERYSYLGYPINKVPTEISAIEDLYNTQPYLLNNDSLALNDIVKQLKLSRDFRPILHMGWRQPVSNRRNAIPIKIFAGDNLQQYYLDQTEIYLQQRKQVLAQENTLNSLLTPQQTAEITLTEQEQILENKKSRINQIIAQLSSITDNTPKLMNDIARSPFHYEMGDLSTSPLMVEPPTPPVQPWYLQGFMQIYINNRNRLNIIADFNLLNMTLAEQETMKLRPNAEINLQTISFKQRRQVISTETHYFDHPYLGMIVQIRRHERPDPPSDETIENVENN
ncbi:CsiV family protein [Thalassotalea piscium]